MIFKSGNSLAHRTVICFFIMMLMFFSCILRLAVLAAGDYTEVISGQSSLRLTVGKVRGTVYDRNMVPLTNRNTKIIAAVSPTPRAVTAISSVLKDEELETLLERLKDGKPVLTALPEEIECDGIECIKVFEHYSSDTPAVHLVGYTDSENHGASGLSAAYDGILYSDKTVSFVYTVDGLGQPLLGVKPEIENGSAVTAGGLVTTIDVNLQSIAESVGEGLESGAVIIADAKSNEILAMASFPDFDITRVGDYLNEKNSPLLNRAVSAYNVGSVFKPCVAAAGIGVGEGDFCNICTGGSQIVDRIFKCHLSSGHGYLGLKGGLANSCNTYFYAFASRVGSKAIYNMASSLNFGKSLKIAEGLYTVSGSMPSVESLLNPAALANFSIGQGKLLLSPVSILTLYSAIAADGRYYVPSVVKGTLKDGRLTPYKVGSPTRVMSEQTAEQLREYLTAVITEGTGKKAKPKTVTAAGKTATAQTGRYENGREICEGWFCGFFPVEKPQYVVVVFSENTAKQRISCGEVFAEIADRIG